MLEDNLKVIQRKYSGVLKSLSIRQLNMRLMINFFPEWPSSIFDFVGNESEFEILTSRLRALNLFDLFNEENSKNRRVSSRRLSCEMALMTIYKYRI